MGNPKTYGTYLVRLVVRNARELLTRCTIRLILTLTKIFYPSSFHPHPKISHPLPRKCNFFVRNSFFTQNYSLQGCFNFGNSEHVKDIEAKIIIQVLDGKYKSLRHLCDFLWFLSDWKPTIIYIGGLNSTNWYRLSYNQAVKINKKTINLSVKQLFYDLDKKHHFSQ